MIHTQHNNKLPNYLSYLLRYLIYFRPRTLVPSDQVIQWISTISSTRLPHTNGPLPKPRTSTLASRYSNSPVETTTSTTTTQRSDSDRHCHPRTHQVVRHHLHHNHHHRAAMKKKRSLSNAVPKVSILSSRRGEIPMIPGTHPLRELFWGYS